MKNVDIIKCLNSLFVKAGKERTFEEENALNEAKDKIRGYPAVRYRGRSEQGNRDRIYSALGDVSGGKRFQKTKYIKQFCAGLLTFPKFGRIM